VPACAMTVVVATKDRREQALATMSRLQGLPERPRVVLVDNGSADGTADAVEHAYPDVTVLRPGRNLGAQARTLGVRAARTDYVAFADDDSWWAPGALTRAAQLFDAHPRLGLVAARTLVGPEERLDPVSEQMAASPLGTDPDLPGPSVLGFLACSAIVRRSAYLQVGGFSPVIFFGGEESLLAQDLAAAGWGVVYVHDIVAHHHPAARGPESDRVRLLLRNALLSIWLRRPASVAARHTGRVLRGLRDEHVRGALLDALRRVPEVVAARRTLPPEVEGQLRMLEEFNRVGA
jgi:GT2 family glycosyltransferase